VINSNDELRALDWYLVSRLFDFEMYRNRKRTVQSIALKILSPIPLPETFSRETETNSFALESIPASGNSMLACRVWQGIPGRCVILYLHGIEGHSQWFEPTARVLNESGITVYAADRRGAGLNSEDRGHLTSLNVFISDVETMLKHIRRKHPDQPIVLFANCWSAKAAAFIARRDHRYADGSEPVELSGLIMTCPAIITSANFDLLTRLKIAVYSFLGEQGRRRIYPIPLTTEMLTDNLSYIDYLQNDPLRLHSATVSFFRETFILGVLAQRFAKQIDLPLLVLQAENDKIIDVEKLKKWYEQVASTDKVWRLYANATHSLDFDAHCFNDYTSLLTEWLLKRTEAKTRS
jgi:acylglycerol lipase